MKIFVPFTEIQQQTLESLEGYEFESVRMQYDDSYPRYFQKRWEEGSTFINCEHDTVFGPGCIESLEQCPEIWCAYVNRSAEVNFATYAPPLALMKITDTFIGKFQHVWEIIYTDPRTKAFGGDPPWLWCDRWLGLCVSQSTDPIVCHQHYPPVINANPRTMSKTVKI